MPQPLPEEIAALGPERLRNFRAQRYHGDDQCLPLAAFTDGDRAAVRELYRFLQELFAFVDDHGDTARAATANDQRARAKDFIARQDISALVGWVRAFGPASLAANPTEHMAKTIHDLRGGGLTSLLGQLQLAQMRGIDGDGLRSLFFLARDHLKIMRNALLGLDDAKREEDLKLKLHSIDFIVAKWQRAVLHGDMDKQARLEIDCEFHGNISECCVEFGALDRVLYNFLNNACRHTADDAIQLVILPRPEANPENLRFAVVNRINAEDDARLAGRPLRELFRPGVSSTGSGLGMTVAADFVTNAYGLSDRESALDGSYFGAKLLDERRFVAWFHWPIVPGI